MGNANTVTIIVDKSVPYGFRWQSHNGVSVFNDITPQYLQAPTSVDVFPASPPPQGTVHIKFPESKKGQQLRIYLMTSIQNDGAWNWVEASITLEPRNRYIALRDTDGNYILQKTAPSLI